MGVGPLLLAGVMRRVGAGGAVGAAAWARGGAEGGLHGHLQEAQGVGGVGKQGEGGEAVGRRAQSVDLAMAYGETQKLST